MLGKKITLLDNAQLNASGNAGGGEVLIGGDKKGINPTLPNAKQAYIAEGAKVKADALSQGDGGKIIVFAEKNAEVYGQLSARGGAQSGDGGFIEVSGKES